MATARRMVSDARVLQSVWKRAHAVKILKMNAQSSMSSFSYQLVWIDNLSFKRTFYFDFKIL